VRRDANHGGWHFGAGPDGAWSQHLWRFPSRLKLIHIIVKVPDVPTIAPVHTKLYAKGDRPIPRAQYRPAFLKRQIGYSLLSFFVRTDPRIHYTNFLDQRPSSSIGATTVGTGGDWSPTFRLGTNNILVPQLLGCSFQKARNFTSWSPPICSDHQNAGFSIWVFKNSPGLIPPDPHSGRVRPPPAPNTHAARPLAGRGAQAPRCWDRNLGPLNFSAWARA